MITYETKVSQQESLLNILGDSFNKRILIDIDGVLAVYDFPLLVKKYFGVDLGPLSIYAYDLADVLGVSNKAIDFMCKEQVYGDPNLVEGAIKTLEGWHKQGYELVIFSNRVKYMGEIELATWLVRYAIPFDGIDVYGTGEYDYHIDDSPTKLMNTNSITKLLYSQPWNKKCLNITGKLQRVRSWAEIRRIVS